MTDIRTVELGSDRSLHLHLKGEGPDVMFVHGALATSEDWLCWPLLDRLVEQGHRVIVIDRPGHGLSRRPRLEGTPRAQAAQIRDALDVVGVQRPVIVSHSLGGMVSLAFAQSNPERVASLVMVAPLAFPELRLLEHSLLAPRSVPVLGPLFSTLAEATFDRPMLKIVQRLMWSPQAVPDWWERRYPYQQLLTSAAMVAEGEDAAAVLPMAPAGMIDVTRIETPAQILTGTSDKVVDDKRQAKLLARLMPNARLQEVEGVGHMLHHTRPELVLEAVTEALAPA